ncbi:MAG TPA: hypothetical protein VKY85_21590 [Candidatus Angelobacter sp.]|nr:hypothetical protein [Candidatus Angelobacter sp.]
MIILKLAALTCIFYMSIALIMHIGMILWAALGKGGVAIFMKWAPFAILFGIVWLISFSLAWHFVSAWVATKVPR